MRLRVESLENRSVPAAFTVNTLFDTPDAMVGDGVAEDANGRTSLRAAIQEGNASADAAVSIGFTLQAGSTRTHYLASALPALNKNFTITGLGYGTHGVRRDAAAKFSIFTINAGKTCSISGLTIAGGDSATGSGGGFYIVDASVTFTTCTLSGNSADGYGPGGAWHTAYTRNGGTWDDEVVYLP